VTLKSMDPGLVSVSPLSSRSSVLWYIYGFVVFISTILFVGLFLVVSMCSFIMMGRYEVIFWFGVFCLGFWDICFVVVVVVVGFVGVVVVVGFCIFRFLGSFKPVLCDFCFLGVYVFFVW
jgi:hypothetical protein